LFVKPVFVCIVVASVEAAALTLFDI